MSSIAVLGNEGTQTWLAAREFSSSAVIKAYSDMTTLLTGFSAGDTEFTLFPVYNTREGERKQHFRFFDKISSG